MATLATAATAAAGGSSSSAATTDLFSAEREAESRLLTCRRLAAATNSVVDALSNAGSGLQHAVTSAQGSDLQKSLAAEDAFIQQAAHLVFEACGGIGATLIDLAAALCGDLQLPLQNLERAIASDRAQRRSELDELRKRHQACATAVTESLRRKDRAAASLKAAMERCDKDGEKSHVFDFRTKEDRTQEAETRLQQMMEQQSAAVEEFGTCVEQAMAVNSAAQLATEALAGVLGFADVAVQRTLCASLGRCAGAWDATVEQLRGAAARLRGRAAEATPSEPAGAKVACPSWAVIEEVDMPAGVEEATEAASERGADASGALVAAEPSGEVGVKAGGEVSRQLSEGWAELEAARKASMDAQDTREIQLLEREAQLHELQAELEMQHQALNKHRKSLALDQARHMAMLDRTPACNGRSSPENFELCGNTPQDGGGPADGSSDNLSGHEAQRRRSTAFSSVVSSMSPRASPRASAEADAEGSAGAEALPQAPALPVAIGRTTHAEDAASDGADADGNDGVDEVWDMDWSSLASAPTAGRSDSTGALAPAPATLPAAAAGSRGGSPADVQREAGPGQARRGPGSNRHLEEETPTFSDRDREELQRKLERQRWLADKHNGEDLTVVPRTGAAVKTSMPGVPPDMAAKLEARRRLVDAADA